MVPETETSSPPLLRTMPGQGHPHYIPGAGYLSIYVSIHHVGCQRGVTELKTTCCDVTRQTAAPEGSLFPAEVCGAGAACSPVGTVPRGPGCLLPAGLQREFRQPLVRFRGLSMQANDYRAVYVRTFSSHRPSGAVCLPRRVKQGVLGTTA